jgi:ABC-type oligopeptide transport system substrate-binding subunit
MAVKLTMKIKIFKGDIVMKKCKLWLLAVLTVLCMSILAGCSTKNNTENGSSAGESGSTAAQQETTMGNTDNNTENNTTTNNGNVTEHTSEGVIDELVTDIGDGIEDIGNGLAGDENSNVNDVTSGRSR